MNSGQFGDARRLLTAGTGNYDEIGKRPVTGVNSLFTFEPCGSQDRKHLPKLSISGASSVGYTIAIIGVLGAGAGAWFYWRRRKKPQSPLISLVALQREPRELDPLILAKTAGRVWHADLGDGSAQGADGFVVCAGIANTIFHRDHIFLVNNFPRPYVKDVDAVADSMMDLRTRELFREHKAWFSIDAMNLQNKLTDKQKADWYSRIARLFAELLDDNCLLIFLPDENVGYAINEKTVNALLSDDPLAALRETSTLPVIPVAEDDPKMEIAVQKARETWPQFVAAFESNTGENHAIKAPITHEEVTEFIWLVVTAIEGDRIYGTLANEPADLGPLEFGSKVSVELADLNDWCYLDAAGDLQGGFTVAAMQEIMRRKSLA